MKIQTTRSSFTIAILSAMLLAAPARAATATVKYGPAFHHPVAIITLTGLAMSIASFIAGRTGMRRIARWFDIPIVAINLVGVSMILSVVLTSNGMHLDAALLISVAISGMIAILWIVLSGMRWTSPWRSLRIVSAAIGMILLATPVTLGVTCGTSCFGR